MSAHFDWLTEEESGWELPPSRPPRPPSRRRRHWQLLLLLMLLAIVSGYAYGQLQQRVAAATAAVTEDIRASYRLHYQAAAWRDDELFRTLIGGSNRSWRQTQRALLVQGLLYDRWPLGLRPQAAEPDVLTVSLSSDLRQAELQATQRYTVAREGGAQETVTLRHTVTYRRGRNRWLVTPPPPDFWGEWQVADGRFLTLVYPQRDEEIAQRLLADLETAWIKSCYTLPGVECARDLRLLVRLNTDPEALLTVADATVMLSGRPNLTLPAPTLVGLPVDETGYQALLRGYAAHVITAILIESAGWSCCHQGLFQQALLDYQLSQLGLRPWPLTPAVYREMPGQAIVGLGGLNRFWSEPPLRPLSGHAWQQVYALVQFILHVKPDISAASMQRHLLTAGSYFRWLQQYEPLGALGNRAQQREWLRFIQAQIGPQSPPLSLPEQDIQLLCRSPLSRTIATLYRYDLATATWTSELVDRPFLFMAPLPHDDGVILQEREARWDHSQLLIWRDGGESNASPQSLRDRGLFRIDTEADNLLLYTFKFRERQVAYSLLDLAGCDEGDCRRYELMGAPVRSPDGNRTLLAGNDGILWLGDEQGQNGVEVGRGIAPFWLDNETYGYAHLVGSLTRPPAEIVAVSVITGEVSVLLRLADLQAATPADINFDQLTIHAIARSPADASRLFIAMVPAQDEGVIEEVGALIFDYDRQTGAASLLLRLDYHLGLFNPLLFSPDGHWLVVQSFARPKTAWQLHLYGIATGETHVLTSSYIFAFPGFDWSADGQWLLRVEGGFLHVLAPAYNYEQMIVHDFPGCNFAAWINKP